MLFKAEVNLNYLLLGCKVALLYLGTIVLDQFLLGVTRPSGIMNPGVLIDPQGKKVNNWMTSK